MGEAAAAGLRSRMNKAAAEDSRLIERLAAGDEAALSVLYGRYGRHVYSLAFQVTKDQGASEEITQDVFARVWRNAGQYKPEKASVETWIMRIARNRAIDEIRRRRVRLQPLTLDWDADCAFDIADAREDPEAEVAGAELRGRVRQAIFLLPAEQREAIALAFLQGYTHSRISQALGLPIGTVKTRIRLGMQKLRDLLADADLSSARWGGSDA